MPTRGKRSRAVDHPDAPASRASYRDVLAVSEFRVIFVANVVSVLGTVVAAVALTVLVYEQTRSPALAASVMALSFLPYLVGGILLGAAADRLPARRVLVGCDLASAALGACMGVPGRPVPGMLALLFASGLTAPAAGGWAMARDPLAGVRGVASHRPTRRVLLFYWLVPACAVAPEALAAPYAAHIGQPARAAGFLLMGIPAGTVVADVLAARLLSSRLQQRIIVPAGLLVFAPLAASAATPALAPAVSLLVISGLGSAFPLAPHVG